MKITRPAGRPDDQYGYLPRPLAVALGVVLLAGVVSAFAAGPVRSLVPPPPPIPIPTTPPEVTGALSTASPGVWAICDTIGSAQFLAALGGTLTASLPPLPVDPNEGLSDANAYVNAATTPCLLVPLPGAAPVCSADESFGEVPFVGLRPASLATAQAAALEQTLNSAGLPAGTPVSGQVFDGAGCTLPTRGVEPALPELPVGTDGATTGEAVPAGSGSTDTGSSASDAGFGTDTSSGSTDAGLASGGAGGSTDSTSSGSTETAAGTLAGARSASAEWTGSRIALLVLGLLVALGLMGWSLAMRESRPALALAGRDHR